MKAFKISQLQAETEDGKGSVLRLYFHKLR